MRGGALTLILHTALRLPHALADLLRAFVPVITARPSCAPHSPTAVGKGLCDHSTPQLSETAQAHADATSQGRETGLLSISILWPTL
ncbi:hypothetical protein Aple_100520 [Acrocarpospora pleiomorpha]|uniref:Uncharacterized protein n=1 Tax=Acrocarpospora pleiomorpha TaxID=90975 RepID=A0A5M3Y4L8_9ACTN|nr:hypothetical protein Aple_100520 [Acrocarpospora pleiomorpha]